MLGLGSGLIYGSPSETILIDYTSDFSSDVDGWVELAVADGNMTITANQNPSSEGGPDEGGWLKINWDTNQTGGSAFKKDLHNDSIIDGDDIIATYKIFIPNSSNQFIGSDAISYGILAYTDNSGFSVAKATPGDQVETETITTFSNSNTDEGEAVRIQFNFSISTDYPQAGANVYIKDFTFLHTRCC